MKDIRNLNKISFFERGGYTIIDTSTSTIINIFLLALVGINIFLQYRIMNYDINITDMIKLFTTPWVIINITLIIIYNLIVVKKVYFTIEGEKSFTDLLDQYIFIFFNRSRKGVKNKGKFILKNI